MSELFWFSIASICVATGFAVVISLSKNKDLVRFLGMIACVLAITFGGISAITDSVINQAYDMDQQEAQSQPEVNPFIGLIPIPKEVANRDHLYYDPNSHIVYLCGDSVKESGITPYYSFDGWPYRYDPEAGVLENIQKGE